MSKFCIIGRHGFIGSALSRKLGDVTSYPTKDTKVLFHFGSHTHPVFDKNPEYEMKQVIQSFVDLLPLCQERGILFVYPSSALVYEKETQFGRFKKTLESLVACYKTISLGLRIFPTYGPGETHTVISQACARMANGERPVIYGDGTQQRDFIHIDDVVSQIVSLIGDPRWASRIVDIGAGNPISFNEIVGIINSQLGTSILPQYVPIPESYSHGIVCPNPLPALVTMDQGIRRLLKVTAHEQLVMA
jgi:nucleoside-diphosphate-sugar epimerase